jgi:hypothetical protein
MRGTYLAKLSVLALVQFFLLSTAYAGLGENESTLSRDYQALNGVQKTLSDFTNYHVYTFLTDGKVIIKEYVNTSGIIFAVTTSGIVQPDLDDLLGRYYREYTNMNDHHYTPGRRHGSTKTDHIVVEEGGHMMSAYMKAWVPRELPTGMSDNEIQ